MFGKPRYGNPTKYWELSHIYTVWLGERHFYISSHYQKQMGTEPLQPFPRNIPPLSGWVSQFQRPVSHAFNPATGLRFTLWINVQPYAFAIEAKVEPKVEGDIEVHTLQQLEAWKFVNGIHPSDLQSTASMNLLARLILQPVNAIMNRIPLASFSMERWRDWRAWGGEYQFSRR